MKCNSKATSYQVFFFVFQHQIIIIRVNGLGNWTWKEPVAGGRDKREDCIALLGRTTWGLCLAFVFPTCLVCCTNEGCICWFRGAEFAIWTGGLTEGSTAGSGADCPNNVAWWGTWLLTWCGICVWAWTDGCGVAENWLWTRDFWGWTDGCGPAENWPKPNCILCAVGGNPGRFGTAGRWTCWESCNEDRAGWPVDCRIFGSCNCTIQSVL